MSGTRNPLKQVPGLAALIFFLLLPFADSSTSSADRSII